MTSCGPGSRGFLPILSSASKFPCHPQSHELIGAEDSCSLQYSSRQKLGGVLEGIWMLVGPLAWLDVPKTVPIATNGCSRNVSLSHWMMTDVCGPTLPWVDPVRSSFLCFCLGSGGARWAEAAVCKNEGQVFQCLQDGAHHFSSLLTSLLISRNLSQGLSSPGLDSRKPKLICQAKLMRKERSKRDSNL